MIKLRFGYAFIIIITGFILLLGWIGSLPDGKLRIVFCNVGQGDAAYIRFPDGRDMLIDGGPNRQVLECLGRHMPFWDRHLNLVLLTHPQRDHLQGLIDIVDRFRIEYFLKSNVANQTDGYKQLVDKLKQKKVQVKFLLQNETIDIGEVHIKILWPSERLFSTAASPANQNSIDDVLGITTTQDPNDFSIVLSVNYGSFDAVFPGDADTRVESNYDDELLAINSVEVLKFPHHGSRTGMTSSLLRELAPQSVILSLGKNSYGHPSEELLRLLDIEGIPYKRTDINGDIVIETDGISWTTKTTQE